MEIISPNKDFGFNSSRSTPYPSAPSAPKGFGDYYFSAPPSPAHLPELCRDFDDFYVEDTKSCSEFLMEWGGKPISPKFKRERTIFNDDFAFDVRGEFERMTLPAEELFDGGKIRPLKPHTNVGPENREGISHDSKSSHDLTASAHEGTEPERGRGRKLSSLPSSRSRRTRSVSPYRVSKYPWEEEEEERPKKNTKQSAAGTRKAELTSTSSSLSSTSKNGNKKWRLKDLFLFRSASEGRATDKVPLIKRTALFKRNDEAKKSSFKSIEAGSNSNRRGPVSAHEKHYTKNRAVSEDLKKKTFLPYKQGILGKLSFNPAVHALSNGFGFSRK